MKGIEFRPEEYKQAAEEHVKWARILHDEVNAYALAVYVSGLAVECLFRGFHAQFSAEFDARHDLQVWAVKSGFADRVPAHEQQKYSTALGEISIYWSNKHRYRSEASLRNHYRKFRMLWKIKGDPLKELSRKTLNAALDLISLGEVTWKN